MKAKDISGRKYVREADQSYQLDAIVSLFAVMLVVLVVLVSSRALNDGKTELEYLPATTREELFVLRSINTPYAFRETWLMTDSELLFVNRERVATLLNEKITPIVSGFRDGNSSVSFFPEEEAVGQWRVRMTFKDDPIDASFISERIDIEDKQALTEWALRKSAILLYVWPRGRPVLASVVSSLRKASRPHKLRLLRGDNKPISLSRTGSNFKHEKILRSY